VHNDAVPRRSTLALGRRMYSYIYDSTGAFYSRQKIDGAYVEKYAVVTLSLLAFLNLMTVLLVCLHLKFQWAEAAFSYAHSMPTELLAAAFCLFGVQVYSTLRGRTVRKRSNEGGQSWIGGAYIVVSFALMVFTAKWAPQMNQPVPSLYLEGGHLKESSAP
jgi:hypothetical protein